MPDVRSDSSTPEPGVDTPKPDAAAVLASKDSPDQSPELASEEVLMKTKAFTETVQEEITSDNDALVNRVHTTSDIGTN